MSDLYIVDNEFSNAGNKYVQICSRIETCIKDYVDALKTLKNGAITGDAANSIEQFADLVSSRLSGNLDYVGGYLSSSLDTYVPDIDVADGDIYKF